MTSTIYYNCLVCHEKIETSIEKIEETSELFAEKLQSLYWIFCGHMKVDTDEDFDFLTEPFPFCKICTSDVIELSRSHRKISSPTLKEQKISKIIAKLSCKILATVPGPSNNFKEERLVDNDGMASTRNKILGIRQSIITAYNLKIKVERIDPVTEKERLLTSQEGEDEVQFVFSQNEADMPIEDVQESPDVNTEEEDKFYDESFSGMESEEDFDDDNIGQPSDESMDEDDVAAKLFPVELSGTDEEEEPSPTKRRRNVKSTNVKKKETKEKDNVKKTKTPKSTAKVKTPRNARRRRGRSYLSVKELECDNSKSYRKFLYDEKYIFEQWGEEYKCCTCNNYTGTTRKNVVQHMRNQHAYVGKFPCSKCDRVFNRLFEKKIHELSHTDETPFLCSECGLAFKSERLLNIHSKIQHETTGPWKFTCDCGLKFRYIRFLLQHQRVYHTGEKPFVCPTCNKGFALKDSYLRHLRTHLEVKPFLCDKCPANYNLASHLKAHVARSHDPDKPRRPYRRKADKWKQYQQEQPQQTVGPSSSSSNSNSNETTQQQNVIHISILQ